MRQTFTVEKEFHNTRFDRWFRLKIIQIPQSLIEKALRQNKIKINKKKIKSSYRLQIGDEIQIFDISKFEENKKSKILKYKPSRKESSLYDDYIIENNDNFMIINKPSGIPVQSGTKSFKNIIDILKDSKFFKDYKPYIVHRLDKETSGVLIIAKKREYAQLFTSLFRLRKIHKTYLAITYGKIPSKIKVLKDDLVFFENKKKITQKAVSYVKTIKTNDYYSLVELNPVTGRKHQLRKQLLNIGNPIVGDDKYFIGSRSSRGLKNKKLLLHASKIKFMINNTQFNFKARYNANFENFLKKNLNFT